MDLVFLAVGIIFLVLYFRFKASLIIAIKAIIEKQETSFGKAYKASQLFYGRILAVYLFMTTVLMLLLVLISSPIIHFAQQKHTIQASVLGGIGTIVFLPAALAIGFIMVLAPMFVVIYDLKVKESVQKSLDLISMHWANLVGLGLLLFVVQLVVVPFGFLAQFLYYKGGLWPILLFVVTSVVLLVLLSVISVLQQVAWVLAFQELIKPQKFEEEKTAIAPEVIG